MRGSLLVAQSELYRDLRSRSTWVLTVLVGLVPLIRVLAWRLAEAPERLRRAQSGTSQSAEELAGAGWAPLVESWRFGLVLGGLALLIHFARGLAGDHDTGMARLAVTRSVSRSGLVLGRALLIPFYVVAMAIVTGCAAWFSVTATYELGDLIVDGYTLATTDELRSELTKSVLITLPPLLCLCSFGLLVSAATRSAVAAVALSAAGFLGYDLFKEVLGNKAAYVFASYVPTIFDESAMHEMVQVALGYSDAGMSSASVNAAAILPWPEAALALGFACLFVSRKRL
jgi:ABC-2 family transporter